MKPASSEVFQLGLRLTELDEVALESLELREIARPLLLRLAYDLGETVHMAIVQSGRAVYVEKVDMPNMIRMYSAVGRTVPLHCTGVGKALLAFSPSAFQEAIIAQGLLAAAVGSRAGTYRSPPLRARGVGVVTGASPPAVDVDELAAELLAAEAGRAPVEPLSARHPGLDVASAYRVQGEVIRRRLGSGDRLRGPGVDAAALLAATRHVVPSLEIIDSRIVDWRIALVDTVADKRLLGDGRER